MEVLVLLFPLPEKYTKNIKASEDFLERCGHHSIFELEKLENKGEMSQEELADLEEVYKKRCWDDFMWLRRLKM